MKPQKAEVSVQNLESEEIDRLFNEAYAIIRERREMSKDKDGNESLLGQTAVALKEKIVRLSALKITGPALGKIEASLENPALPGWK